MPSSRPTLFVLCLLLSACAGVPPRESGPGGDAVSAAGAASARAEAALAAGRYRDAARAFEALAATEPDQRSRALLRAADAAWKAGDAAETQRLLTTVDERRLAPANAALARLLTAAIRRDELAPHRLLALVDGAASDLAAADRPLYHRLRAEALAASGQPYASARERIRLGRLLPESEAAEANRLALARSLQRLTADQARRLIQFLDEESEMVGWLDLVASVKEALFAGADPDAAIAAWRGRHPGHPAGRGVADQLLADYDRGFAAPEAVAVLLPETGPLATAARAVRDGLVAAHLAQGARGELAFYDSGAVPATAVEAFRRALADGAGAIVGPLERDAVTAVLLEARGTVPVLALNYPATETPFATGVYQFGLLPEQEAAAAAERMLKDGHSRAATLTPDTVWGRRLERAFVDRFTTLGGVIQARSAYPDDANDFGALIENLVGLHAAQQRRRELQSALGLRLDFEARRRPDLDALFLGARPREGRLIKPQLAFHGSGDLPVYATSHVYGGSPAPDRDGDLDGIRFCDAPWVLESQGFGLGPREARAAFASAGGSGGRLFALGFDALRLLPYLDWLARYPDDRFPGATGQLQVTAGGRVERTPDCAEFRRGEPRYLGTTPELAARCGEDPACAQGGAVSG